MGNYLSVISIRDTQIKLEDMRWETFKRNSHGYPKISWYML